MVESPQCSWGSQFPLHLVSKTSCLCFLVWAKSTSFALQQQHVAHLFSCEHSKNLLSVSMRVSAFGQANTGLPVTADE
jgi:hypothetical protein